MSHWKEMYKIILKHKLPIKPRGFSAIYIANLIKEKHFDKLSNDEKKKVLEVLS